MWVVSQSCITRLVDQSKIDTRIRRLMLGFGSAKIAASMSSADTGRQPIALAWQVPAGIECSECLGDEFTWRRSHDAGDLLVRPHAGDAVHGARRDLASVLNLVVADIAWLASAHDLAQEGPVRNRRRLQGAMVPHLYRGTVCEVEKVWSALDERHVVIGEREHASERIGAGPLYRLACLGRDDREPCAGDRGQKPCSAAEVRVRSLMTHTDLCSEFADA